MSNDVFPDIEYPIAELIVGCGFFIVLSLEQIVMSCCTKSKKSKKNVNLSKSEINYSQTKSTANGDIHLNGIRGPMDNEIEDHSVGTHIDGSLDRSGTQLLIDPHGQVLFDGSICDYHAHFDPAAHSTLRVLILVGALALHAVFEGLVFGVSQEPVSAMLGTAVAVVIHKSIIARGIRL
ncbi:unnamed protein product [Oikopleura dioica]|uniref:Uncharacterized protein n=1 Tax=Oikopleura dioica TaxID=34765 RepID=E4WV36_OIKDI|nr:unnamed protein product [Oikopleura dioica]